jgi:hypothetical protein
VGYGDSFPETDEGRVIVHRGDARWHRLHRGPDGRGRRAVHARATGSDESSKASKQKLEEVLRRLDAIEPGRSSS